jgi:transcriptional regulator with XRE-family HTH domain
MANPPATPESLAFGREALIRRKHVRLTQEQLADRLNVVRSYISQIERGQSRIREDFAQKMDEVLGTTPELHDAWNKHIAPLLEALLKDDKAFEARVNRQGFLTGENPPLLRVVLEESVLYREIGSRQVMREQLEWLLEVSTWQRVVLQVIRFAYHEEVIGPFSLVTLPDRREFAYITHAWGGEETREPEHLAKVVASMARLQAEALNAPDTRAFIRKVIDQRWT